MTGFEHKRVLGNAATVGHLTWWSVLLLQCLDNPFLVGGGRFRICALAVCGGAPDRTVDLEQEEGRPFADNSFDRIVCSDVLGLHNNIHRIFAEQVRVTCGHVLLSLPKNWTNARRPVARGKGAIGHYGLPADPPLGRHKWVFSLSEAGGFIRGQQRKVSFDIVELFAMEKPRFAPVKLVRQLTTGSQSQCLNRYAHTLWAGLKKK